MCKASPDLKQSAYLPDTSSNSQAHPHLNNYFYNNSYTSNSTNVHCQSLSYSPCPIPYAPLSAPASPGVLPPLPYSETEYNGQPSSSNVDDKPRPIQGLEPDNVNMHHKNNNYHYTNNNIAITVKTIDNGKDYGMKNRDILLKRKPT